MHRYLLALIVLAHATGALAAATNLPAPSAAVVVVHPATGVIIAPTNFLSANGIAVSTDKVDVADWQASNAVLQAQIDSLSPSGLVTQADIDAAVATRVSTSRVVSTGYGLTGGGALSADRDLAVDTNTIASRAWAATTIGTSNAAERARADGLYCSIPAETYSGINLEYGWGEDNVFWKAGGAGLELVATPSPTAWLYSPLLWLGSSGGTSRVFGATYIGDLRATATDTTHVATMTAADVVDGAGKGKTASQPGHGHAASDVTSGTFADARAGANWDTNRTECAWAPYTLTSAATVTITRANGVCQRLYCATNVVLRYSSTAFPTSTTSFVQLSINRGTKSVTWNSADFWTNNASGGTAYFTLSSNTWESVVIHKAFGQTQARARK